MIHILAPHTFEAGKPQERQLYVTTPGLLGLHEWCAKSHE